MFSLNKRIANLKKAMTNFRGFFIKSKSFNWINNYFKYLSPQSSPRKQNNKRFPESPRLTDRSESSLPRFNNTGNRRQNTLMKQDTFDEDRTTPRSSRSTSEKDDFNNMNMLSTMRHPLNENSTLSKSIRK